MDGFKSCAGRSQSGCACKFTTCRGSCGWDCNYEVCFWNAKTGSCADPRDCTSQSSQGSCNGRGCIWHRQCDLAIGDRCILWGTYACFVNKTIEPQCGCDH